MNEHAYDDIDEIQAARITKQIDATLGFLEDLIDDPSPLAQIPMGSTLAFRTIRIQGQQFRLTAHRPSSSTDGWLSRVTSRAGDRQGDFDLVADEMVETGQTAESALDALERALQQRASHHLPRGRQKAHS